MKAGRYLRRREFLAGCGTCLAHCPQGLDVPAKLAAARSLPSP